MESILVSNVMMDRVLCPFVFNMYYRCGMNGGPYKDKFAHDTDASTPAIRNIQIQNCMITDARAAAGFFYGLPEMPIDNIKISDCTIRMKDGDQGGDPAMMEDLPPMAQEGIFMRNATNVVFRNVQVIGSKNKTGWDTDETVQYQAN